MTREHFVHVVDDDPASRGSVVFLLGTVGLNCFEYQSGSEFLARAPAGPPGCILLDLLMPRMSGLDVQAELARRRMTWPVIILSACRQTALVAEAVRGGAVEFVVKPYGEEELLTALHRGFAELGRR